MTENKERLADIRMKRDQLTGKGVAGHTNKVVIDGYPIHVQYLTDEVYKNELYQKAVKAGSVTKLRRQLIEEANKKTEEEGGTAMLDDDDFTDDDMTDLLFFVRCERDPSFAFITCFYIHHKKTGKDVPFSMNYAQHKTLELLEKMRQGGIPIRLVLLKARQWGGSTLSQLYMAWIQLFVRTGWNSVVIAQTKDTAKRIKAMYKKVLENFPAWILKSKEIKFSPHMGSANDSVLTNEKDEVIRNNIITIASYENFESTRGADFALAHFSETAYWTTTKSKKAEDVITNIEGNILEEPLTLEINESTAKGMSGYFYDAYQMAKSGKSNRRALFVPFYWIENDMLEFKTAQQKRHFAEELVAQRNNEVAPDEAHESGQYLFSLWLKGASLEHIFWYVKKREGLHSHEQMAQEAPSDDIECFAFSGFRVFSIEHIEGMREQYACAPIWVGDISYFEERQEERSDIRSAFRGASAEVSDLLESKRRSTQKSKGKVTLVKNENGLFRIWKQPDKLKTRNQYLVVVDVGGKNEKSDYSVITVFNRLGKRVPGGKLEVVARWRGHLRYDRMAWKAVAIARYYKNALLVIESNTMDKKDAEANEYLEQGDHIRSILKEIGSSYRNLYKRKSTDPESIKKGEKYKYGFQTNVKTKQDMVDNFIKIFEDGEIIEHDARLYEEAAIYEQRPNGSYGNIVGKDNHDDILMTVMIGCLVELEMAKIEVGVKAQEVDMDDYGDVV